MATAKKRAQVKKSANKKTTKTKKPVTIKTETEEKKVIKKVTPDVGVTKKSGTSTQTKKKTTSGTQKTSSVVKSKQPTSSTKKTTTTSSGSIKKRTTTKKSVASKTTTIKKSPSSKNNGVKKTTKVTPIVKNVVDKKVEKIPTVEEVQPVKKSEKYKYTIEKPKVLPAPKTEDDKSVNQVVKYKYTIEKLSEKEVVLEDRIANWKEATIEITTKISNEPILPLIENKEELALFKMKRSYLVFNIVLAIFLFSVIIIPVGILFYSFTPGANKNTSPFKISLGKYINFGYPIEWTLSSNEDGFSYKSEEDAPILEYVGEITEISKLKEKTLEEYYESIKTNHEAVQKLKVGIYDAVMIQYKTEDKKQDVKSYVFYHESSNRRITITLKLEKHDKYTIALLDEIVKTIILK